MRPETPVSYVPIEARLRNARRLITTLPPIAILAAAAVAVSVGVTPSPTEVARTGAAVVPVSVPAEVQRPELDAAMDRAAGASDQREASSMADQSRQARIDR